ncbi:unnamed protein product [Rangifer tarandus platyrhynchus]|uniref:Uncharacterized protein n=1 Tax=Rangifer tarandus platyrhynchus TaxID=3082113 RepID=A0AC60A8G6_RANTA
MCMDPPAYTYHSVLRVLYNSPAVYTQPPCFIPSPPCKHSPPMYTQHPHVYPAPHHVYRYSLHQCTDSRDLHGYQCAQLSQAPTDITAKQGHRYMGAHTCMLGTYPPRGPRDWETSPNLTAGHAQARPAAQGPQTSLLSLLGCSLGGLCPAWQAPPLSSPSDSHCGRMPLRAGVCMPLCPSTLPRG